MAHWINITGIGDPYEVELDTESDRYRHRPISIGGQGETEWIPGQPPGWYMREFQSRSRVHRTGQPVPFVVVEIDLRKIDDEIAKRGALIRDDLVPGPEDESESGMEEGDEIPF